jgi:hypothetical protein
MDLTLDPKISPAKIPAQKFSAQFFSTPEKIYFGAEYGPYPRP